MAGKDEMPEFSYAARRGQPVLDPAMRRMALGAGGVSVAVIAVALAWSGMKPGLGFGPPPVILAPAGPMRVAPADPGGLTVPEADEQIMSGDGSGDGSGGQAPRLAPPEPPPALAQLSAAAGLPAVGAPGAAPVASAVAAPAVAGDVQVQLASAADEAAEAAAWARLASAMPGVLGDRQPEIVPSVVEGASVWRLRLGGFSDAGAARDFCSRITAKGAGCSVVTP